MPWERKKDTQQRPREPIANRKPSVTESSPAVSRPSQQQGGPTRITQRFVAVSQNRDAASPAFRPHRFVVPPPRASAFGLSPGLGSPGPLGRMTELAPLQLRPQAGDLGFGGLPSL